MKHWQRHLNKLRWISLSTVFAMLILIPYLHLYQTYEASHSYDRLTAGEKIIFDSMAVLTKSFTNDPVNDLNKFKGNTWSGNLFGMKISDPLAVLGQSIAGLTIYWPFVLTALIPVLFTVLVGRVYCGWICPATFLYELNDNLATWLKRFGVPISQRRLHVNLKYGVLIVGSLLCGITGAMLFAAIYPPAVIGRELYFGIAAQGFGIGIIFFLLTLLFDLFVARRGFCRYVCPGGALYSLLGHFRLVRIQRNVATCNDCVKCAAVCQFGLDPMRDEFGQECNNCSACIAVCPTDALDFKLQLKDITYQGPGHLSHRHRQTMTEAPR